MLRRWAAAATAMTLCARPGRVQRGRRHPETPPGSATTETPTASPTEATRLTFGAYGSDDEVEAYQRVVDAFNVGSTTRKVELVTWPDHEAALEAVLGR